MKGQALLDSRRNNIRTQHFAFMISNKIKELKAIEEREKSAQELYRYENL